MRKKAINRLHTESDIPTDDISYVYKNAAGEVKEVDASEISSKTAGEDATEGAVIGGSIGAIAGLATAAGIIPVIGPILAAGPLVTALGIGAGALGTTAAGAATGAIAGGLIGALVSLGANEEHAKKYEDRVLAGDVLLAVHADESQNVVGVLSECGATDVNVYSPM